MDAEWQELVAGSSNSLPFLPHPSKSLFPLKSTIFVHNLTVYETNRDLLKD
jgi:hypothetical protein